MIRVGEGPTGCMYARVRCSLARRIAGVAMVEARTKAQTLADDRRFRLAAGFAKATRKPRDHDRAVGSSLKSRHTTATSYDVASSLA